MDAEAYRQEYLAEAKSAAEGLPAVTPEAVAKYAASASPDDSKLCEMLGALAPTRETFEASVRVALDILANPALGPLARLAAFRLLGAAQFRPARFAPFHAEFIALLRKLALDDDIEIRTAALDRLTLSNDPEAQRMLREGLEKVGKPLVSVAKAIQLLARDAHGSGLPIFRDLAVKGVGKVREEALRALGNDARSVSLFQSLATDKKEGGAIREIALNNLKNMSVNRFAQVARKVVLDNDEDDKLRAAAVSAIAHAEEVAKKVSPRFASAVESIGSATTSRALKTSIGNFTKRLRGD